MGLFWKRKSKDQFVTLGLNEPAERPKATPTPSVGEPDATSPLSPDAGPKPAALVSETELPPVVTGAAPTPIPVPREEIKPLPPRAPQTAADEVEQRPVPSRSPFATSVLGLNLSMEELQAQEAALEQEF